MLSLHEDGLVRSVEETVLNGDVVEQKIILSDGKVVCLGFGMVGVYADEESYQESESLFLADVSWEARPRLRLVV